MKLFLAERGFIDRPTHNRLAALRQASRLFPETGKLREAGRPGPPPFLFFVALLTARFFQSLSLAALPRLPFNNAETEIARCSVLMFCSGRGAEYCDGL